MRRFVGLIALLVLFGVAAGAFAENDKKEAAKESSPAHKAAVAKIMTAGGAVRRIAQDTDENEVSLALAPPPVGDELLSSVASVENVVSLELQGTSISDDGLKKIGAMKNLRRLHLERTGITDEGLKHLSGLTELEYLNLYGTKVSDKGLESVKSLKKLRKLFVWATDVSEEGMSKLGAAMPELAVVGAAKPMVVPKVEKEETMKKSEAKNLTEAQKRTIAAPPKLLGAGVTVRIRLPAKNFLSLAEVEVYEVGKAEKLTGTATQSTTYGDGVAYKAVDGNRDGVYQNGSVTHTAAEGDEWWQLKLAEKHDIGAIYVWNRSDCCGDRLSTAVVEILDEADKVVWSGEVKAGTDGATYDFVGK